MFEVSHDSWTNSKKLSKRATSRNKSENVYLDVNTPPADNTPFHPSHVIHE